jgi:hypothetical protein
MVFRIAFNEFHRCIRQQESAVALTQHEFQMRLCPRPGCSVRATSAMRMSELSSRSHDVFQIVVEIFEGGEEVGRTHKVGKLNIVASRGPRRCGPLA